MKMIKPKTIEETNDEFRTLNIFKNRNKLLEDTVKKSDNIIAQRDSQIAERDTEIAELKSRIAELEAKNR